ncbi:uncharacterized protein LOC132631059 [Lycium barbarum]|uniref:uncharacterized protein LOC132631059 n=1 Tax=Lycium barbarum TaxID=112863 RepID=UPI00293E6045|nr:uncharacterized protein LOC132631059 [Lycium barbarum]
MVNVSQKIWLFWTEEWQAQVIVDSVQHVTIKLSHINMQYEAYVTAVYAKCSGAERQELWDLIGQVALNVHVPWIVGGDFIVILKHEEKLGGLPVHHTETAEFAHFIHLVEGRILEDCIFKRLDIVLGNQDFVDLFPSAEVVHPIRHGSDHAPLHVVCDSQTEVVVKPFKFLNFWNPHPKFMEVVENNWWLDFAANPFNELQAKMKKVKQALAVWSRETYGNIFQQISTMKDLIKVSELQFELNPSSLNREALHKAQADFNRYLCLEEEYWKQKTGMRWFKDEDRNTKFFHNYVKGRRRKLAVHTIQNSQGDWLNTNAEIGQEVVLSINTGSDKRQHQDEDLTTLPSDEEVNNAVFGLNGDTGGPDGFSGHFFQTCWGIIGRDVTNMVRAFFCSQELPRCITHTNLVLIPKKENINTFADLRPISLSSFANKIIFRVLHERIVPLLPAIISTTQTSFVKGRSIVANALLAQEIIKDINKRNKLHNVVVKLDMGKTYDRVS